jgi:ABC-type transport system involved in cytochrome c biogenesis ATPase subunit
MELSTGQRQRVLLSKLLLVESNVWFLDEPFLFLDKDGIILTKKIIFDFIRSGNMVVITTHAVLTDLLSKSVIVYL